MQTYSSLQRTDKYSSFLPKVIRKSGHNIISCFEVSRGHAAYMEQKDVADVGGGEGLKYFNYAGITLVHY